MSQLITPPRSIRRYSPYHKAAIGAVTRVGARVLVNSIAKKLNKGTQTKSSVKEDIPAYHSQEGSSHSSFFVGTRKKQPVKYHGVKSFKVIRDLAFGLGGSPTTQVWNWPVALFRATDIQQVYTDHGTGLTSGTTTNRQQEACLHKAEVRLLFSNTASTLAHCSLYLVKARGLRSQGIDPVTNLTNIVDTQEGTGTQAYNRFGFDLSDSSDWFKQWKIEKVTHFDLKPGEEHLHNGTIILNKTFKPAMYQGEMPVDTGEGEMYLPNITHVYILKQVGQIVHDGSTQDPSTKPSLSDTRVSYVATTKHYVKFAEAEDKDKVYSHDTTLPNITGTDEVFINTDTGAKDTYEEVEDMT